MTRGGGREASESSKGIGGGREEAGCGAAGRSVQAFQFGEIGSAKERKSFG